MLELRLDPMAYVLGCLLFILPIALLPAVPKIQQPSVQRGILTLVSLTLTMLLLEVALRFGIADNLPFWYPQRWVEHQLECEREAAAVASKHPLGFRDHRVSPSKPEGTARIAVVGDSVVWGTALSESERWSTLLEHELRKDFSEVEVLSWGKPGWATVDQYEFMERHLSDWNVDLVIVSYVSNDPDFGDFPVTVLNIGGGGRYGSRGDLLLFMHWLFPNATNFVGSLLQRAMYLVDPSLGFDRYFVHLYSEANLERYRVLIKKLSELLERSGVPSLVVLVPSAGLETSNQEALLRVTPLFVQAGFPVLDLYPASRAELGELSYTERWAHRGDTHPGTKMTTLFARETARYLRAHRSLLPELKLAH